MLEPAPEPGRSLDLRHSVEHGPQPVGQYRIESIAEQSLAHALGQNPPWHFAVDRLQRGGVEGYRGEPASNGRRSATPPPERLGECGQRAPQRNDFIPP